MNIIYSLKERIIFNAFIFGESSKFIHFCAYFCQFELNFNLKIILKKSINLKTFFDAIFYTEVRISIFKFYNKNQKKNFIIEKMYKFLRKSLKNYFSQFE